MPCLKKKKHYFRVGFVLSLSFYFPQFSSISFSAVVGLCMDSVVFFVLNETVGRSPQVPDFSWILWGIFLTPASFVLLRYASLICLARILNRRVVSVKARTTDLYSHRDETAGHSRRYYQVCHGAGSGAARPMAMWRPAGIGLPENDHAGERLIMGRNVNN